MKTDWEHWRDSARSYRLLPAARQDGQGREKGEVPRSASLNKPIWVAGQFE
jgi:hypothetical protein